ncbi:MAG: SHOCT domain-containing protein [Candidatus Diapherotrites archaeon]|nr:SHOCT domain-containing protein [Candidatus Diapherotrites archaeon]
MKSRGILLLILTTYLMSSCYAIVENGSIPIFAVVESETSAVKAELNISIVPGNGRIWSSVGPLIGTSTQHTEKVAVNVARNYSKDVNKYDYMFDIKSDASVVEGPSAGAAMALLLISMLQDKKLPNYVSITGQIYEDGTVGSVGGVYLKAQKAHESGIKLFLIPKGDAYQTHMFPDGIKTVNLVEYAPKNWGLVVVEVSDIDEALKYAFMDLSEIDVNTKIKEQEPFAPQMKVLKDKMKPMKELTKKYIGNCKEEIKEAKAALNEISNPDMEVMTALLESITNAEKLMKDANMLYEANYLYSAANNAFLSCVYAGFVKDVAKNLSLLESDSSTITFLKEELMEKVQERKNVLESFYTLERSDWLIAAKQRILWAETSLKGMESRLTTIEKLKDYEFAAGWYKISGDFYNIALSAKDKFTAKPNLKEIARKKIIEAENCYAKLSEKDDDIERRIKSAKAGIEIGWHDSAIMDAASAYSLCKSLDEIGKKGLSEIKAMIEEKNKEVYDEISKDNLQVWAELYLDHSEYFKKAADYYQAEGMNSKAIDNAKAALSLAYLAEHTFNSSKEIIKALQEADKKELTIKLPPAENTKSQTPATNTGQQGNGKENSDKSNESAVAYIYILAAIAVVAILIMASIFLLHRAELKRHPIKKHLKRKIAKLEEELTKINKLHARGKINSEEYAAKKAEYEKQITNLKNEISKYSKKLVELDRQVGEMKGLVAALEQIRYHYSKGEITDEDYNKFVEDYNAKIEKLKMHIKNASELAEELQKSRGESEPKKQRKNKGN